MSLPFEIDSFDARARMQDAELIADYDEFFSDEDFRALGIDPMKPTTAKPGSEDKVLMLAARYSSGLPLWHEDDCYDHGPAARAEHDLELHGEEVLDEEE